MRLTSVAIRVERFTPDRDERVGVKQFFEGLEFQYRLIKMSAGRR